MTQATEMTQTTQATQATETTPTTPPSPSPASGLSEVMSRLVLFASAVVALWSASVLSLSGCLTPNCGISSCWFSLVVFPRVGSVFSSAPEAHMLLRSRRANSFLEELKPASMERECVEERCDFEEAREIFQTREATKHFTLTLKSSCFVFYSWSSGRCTQSIVGNVFMLIVFQMGTSVTPTCVFMEPVWICTRPTPAAVTTDTEGRYCDLRETQTATNCSVENGGCDHDCLESDDGLTRRCSCLSGYKLHDDSKKCVPKGSSTCGQLLIGRSSYTKPRDGLLPWMVGGEVGKKGESPWQVIYETGSVECVCVQVLLLNARGRFHCGGVLIGESWVLTAAHCLNNNLKFRVRLGDYERHRDEGSEVTLRVEQTFKHPNYNSRTVDNDIALLRLETPAPFSEFILPICLPGREMAERVLHLNGTPTVVSGWGKDIHDQYSSALNVIKIPTGGPRRLRPPDVPQHHRQRPLRRDPRTDDGRLQGGQRRTHGHSVQKHLVPDRPGFVGRGLRPAGQAGRLHQSVQLQRVDPESASRVGQKSTSTRTPDCLNHLKQSIRSGLLNPQKGLSPAE
ncbi:hypothetical protein L3Q82_021118, partial [Scortum barcoo]